jgi:hypothetical protein
MFAAVKAHGSTPTLRTRRTTHAVGRARATRWTEDSLWEPGSPGHGPADIPAQPGRDDLPGAVAPVEGADPDAGAGGDRSRRGAQAVRDRVWGVSAQAS